MPKQAFGKDVGKRTKLANQQELVKVADSFLQMVEVEKQRF